MTKKNIEGKNGFTLIELMIVASIIGLLASIAIPKFSDLITRAQEAKIKGQLASVRSSLQIYYADTEGEYPFNISALIPKYIDKIPKPPITKFQVPPHSTGLSSYTCCNSLPYSTRTNFDTNLGLHETMILTNNHHFNYAVHTPTSYCRFIMLCSHTDSRGFVYSQY